MEKEKIEALSLPGIDFIEDEKRYYPNGDFASYTIGYAKKNEDGIITGELGIEALLDSALKGVNGEITYQKDRDGRKIAGTKELKVDAKNGDDIYLTIDSNIELFVEQALRENFGKYPSEWAVAVVADAKTGKILAASQKPSYDPNILNIKNYMDITVSTPYEPGSIMKIYTYMAAMEKGTYDGTKPHIQTIISKPVADETIRDEFEKGTIDFYSAGTGEKIEAALTKVEEGKLDANYGLVPGTRINEMRYMCDFGPTQFEEVRRAIAYIVDRDEINKQLTGGYGTVVDCYATDATTDFAAIKDDIESELIHYSYDLDKAKQELIDGGWTLNEKGEEYKEGTDKYRYKEVDLSLIHI